MVDSDCPTDEREEVRILERRGINEKKGTSREIVIILKWNLNN